MTVPLVHQTTYQVRKIFDSSPGTLSYVRTQAGVQVPRSLHVRTFSSESNYRKNVRKNPFNLKKIIPSQKLNKDIMNGT